MTARVLALVACASLLAAAVAPLAGAQPRSPAPAAAPAAPSAASAPRPAPAAPKAAPSSQAKSFADAVPCSACHTTAAWRAKGGTGEATGFDHATTGFPLSGQHKNATCVSCHSTTRALKRECASCHEDPHRGRLMRSCDNCHVPASWKLTRPLEIHRMTRFPLTGMHVLADCSECHRRASEHQWTGAPVECFACHEQEYRRADLRPVHIGSATSPSFPRDCSQCHRPIAWAPALFTPGALGSGASALRGAPPNHDLRFPIAFGVHRTATCDDCHSTLAVPRAVRCIGCHAHDPARVMQQHRQPVATDGSACLSCHPGGARR